MKQISSKEEYFDKIIDSVSNYKQIGELTYPSIDNYKENLVLYINTLLVGEKGIAVESDFDNDGIMSGIILWSFSKNAYRILRGDGAEEMSKLYFTNRQDSFGVTQKEYELRSKENDLVIPVDNGSDLPYLTEEMRGKMIVLDHHPSKQSFSFVLNPNTGRGDAEPYSTSGGRIVFDFVANAHNVMMEHIPEYANERESNERLLETLKVLAGITLVSDMAILDRDNRAFVSEAIDIIKKDKERLLLFGVLKEFTTRNFSFDIISQINGLSRMEQDLNLAKEWIALGDKDQWNDVNSKVRANNDKKKSIVSSTFRSILSSINQRDPNEKSLPVESFLLEKTPIGILGLVANKIASKLDNKPTIVCGVNDAGDMQISARGKNVKVPLQAVFERSGGHDDACGGLEPVPPNSSIKDVYWKSVERLEAFCMQNKEFFDREYKTEVISQQTFTPSDFLELHDMFRNKSNGVDFYKTLNIMVHDFQLIGGVQNQKTYKSGWANLSICDANIQDPSESDILSFWIDTHEFPIHNFGGDKVLIFDLTVNHDISLNAVINRGDIQKKTELIAEAVELGIEYLPKENREIPKIEDNNLSNTIAYPESFYPTERERVVLIERYTKEMVENNPNTYFVFGDNMIGKGTKGQAIIRGYENTIGIPTKRLPSMDEEAFFGDRRDEQMAIVNALQYALDKYNEGYTIAFPADGVGTGLAKMREKSPALFRAMNEIIAKNFTEKYRILNDDNPQPLIPKKRSENLGGHGRTIKLPRMNP